MKEHEKDHSGATPQRSMEAEQAVPAPQLSHAGTSNTEHSRTCDLVGFRQGYNAPPVCSCGLDKGHQ